MIKRTGTTLYAIYDALAEGEPIVSVGNLSEICEEFECSKQLLSAIVIKEQLLHRRYRVVKLGKECDFE